MLVPLHLIEIYREHLKHSKLARAGVFCSILCVPALGYGLLHLLFGLTIHSQTTMVILGGMFMTGTFFGCLLVAVALFKS